MTLPEYVVTRKPNSSSSSLELNFEKGQIIRIISKSSRNIPKGYFLGEFATSNNTMEPKIERTGIFPESHVAPFANFFHNTGTMPRTDPEKDELIKIAFQARVNLVKSFEEKRKINQMKSRVDDLEDIMKSQMDYV